MIARDYPESKVLACYGLLVRAASKTEALWLRFVNGRPVSALITTFLACWWSGITRRGTEARPCAHGFVSTIGTFDARRVGV